MRTLAAVPTDPDDPEGPSDISGTVVTDLEALRQRIRQRLRFPRGEWQLDPGAGTDSVIGHQLTAGMVGQIISATIRDEGGREVLDVVDVEVELDRETRQFSYSASVVSVYGTVALEPVTF